MKSSLILCLILTILPVAWLPDLRKDKLVVFSSLSYYKCDFDGDNICDLSVWDPKSSTLYFQLSRDNKSYEKKFFDTEVVYQPVFADYDGDLKTDFVFFHGDSGQWVSFYTSATDLPRKVFLGSIGDLPIPSKQDGQYRPTVWRPKNADWLLTREKDGFLNKEIISDGSSQDSVFGGDYDGDGKSDLINWRPDDGVWHIVKSGTNFDFNQSEHIQHGQAWDVIVPNDYDADGRCDLVVWRKSNQTWYFKYAKDGSQNEIKFGEANDIPASADIDGDGIPELITWNASQKTWNVLNFKKQESYSYKWNVPSGCLPAISILQTSE